MAAQGAFGTDFYDRSTIEIGPKGALGSHEIRPIHSAPSLGQSIEDLGDNDIALGLGPHLECDRFRLKTI